MLLSGEIANKEKISPSPGVRSVIMIQPQLPLQLQLCLFLLLSSPSTSAVFKCSACPVSFKKKKTLTRHWKEIQSTKCLFMECPVKDCTYETKRLPDIHRHLRSSHPGKSSLKPTQIIKRWKVNPSYSSPSTASSSATVLPTVVTPCSRPLSAPGLPTALTSLSAPSSA